MNSTIDKILTLGIMTAVPMILAALVYLFYDVRRNNYIGRRRNQAVNYPNEETFSETISRLLGTLTASSKEMNSVFLEIEKAIAERTEAVARLEESLAELAHREQEAKERVATLEKTPVEVAQYFEEIIKKGDKRSARRDYFLFGLGVILSVVVGIVLWLLGF